MNDFLTEKNKKAGVLGKLKWVLCGFCMLLSLGAIGASEKYIGDVDDYTGNCTGHLGCAWRFGLFFAGTENRQ